MKNKGFIAKLDVGETIENEWSQLSYDLWCRQQAQKCIVFPETRVVNLSELVRSVIENDLTQTEKSVTRLHWYDGLSVEKTAEKIGLSRTSVYRALNRSEEKIKLVVKHVIDCENYKYEPDY